MPCGVCRNSITKNKMDLIKIEKGKSLPLSSETESLKKMWNSRTSAVPTPVQTARTDEGRLPPPHPRKE